jgi:hypothetical protein
LDRVEIGRGPRRGLGVRRRREERHSQAEA